MTHLALGAKGGAKLKLGPQIAGAAKHASRIQKVSYV